MEVDKSQSDIYRDESRRLLAANQPASQVVVLLMEMGASEEEATHLAYSGKIRLFRKRSHAALYAAAAGLILLIAIVISAQLGNYNVGYPAIMAIVEIGVSLVYYLQCQRQINLARKRLAS